jgi:predicted GNAT family acetyltransferase
MDVQHDTAAHQFWLEPEPGQRCVLDYRRQGNAVVFTHTGVPAALQGRGLAAQLVAAGLQWAGEQGLQVIPACNYVASYLRRQARQG